MNFQTDHQYFLNSTRIEGEVSPSNTLESQRWRDGPLHVSTRIHGSTFPGCEISLNGALTSISGSWRSRFSDPIQPHHEEFSMVCNASVKFQNQFAHATRTSTPDASLPAILSSSPDAWLDVGSAKSRPSAPFV